MNLNILYLSSYPPRECGIATFTQDLTTEMDKKFNPRLKSAVLAINDNGSNIYNYDKNVKLQLDEEDIEQYIEVAEKINQDENIKLVSIQHEFGIFGGEYGEFLIPFLEKIEKPVAITFHSVLPDPDEKRLKIVRAIAKRSQAIIVMSKSAVSLLTNVYGVDQNKIHLIHHGVPFVEFLSDNSKLKESLNLSGKIILSTFGLINRGKGIEYVIKSLPSLVQKYPNLLYLIIGETHPKVRKEEGERYRTKLTKLIEKLDLKDHVKFYNKYLTLDEIIKYLQATDIYIYPALDENQIVSGTLAYALGAGKSIIATPSIYAKDMLEHQRGIIVKMKDSESIKESIDNILSNPELKNNLENNAYKFSRKMLWPNVAANHLKVFKKIINIEDDIGMHKFPKINLKHLQTLTDDTGIIQHAKHSLPNRFSGYCIDDNSRALVVATEYYNKFKDPESLKLINIYLSFLYHSQREDGFFQDFMSYTKVFLNKKSSEDSYGRVLWTCGFLLNSSIPDNLKMTAKFIFDNAFKHVNELGSIRSMAFSLIGMYHYYRAYPNDENMYQKIIQVSDNLLKSYRGCSNRNWKWFEDSLTYSNGKIPEALFLAYDVTKKQDYLDVAEESLNFLSSLVILNNKLVLIGHNGWYKRNGKRAFYDQQPIDASSMVQVYMVAYNITRKKEYYDKAILSFNWFLGRNSLNQIIYDENTGGCYDGLLPKCVNLNQGSESTICYLLARLKVQDESLSNNSSS